MESLIKPILLLSFSDFFKALKQRGRVLLLSALFGGLVLSTFFLFQPARYTAEGIFKNTAANNLSNEGMFKFLEMLSSGEKVAQQEDPRSFLKTYPVLEKVVDSLALQASIDKKWPPSRCPSLWRTWQADRLYRRAQREKFASPILKVPVASKLLSNSEKEVICSHIEYSQPIATVYRVIFTDGEFFKVYHRKKYLGAGRLDSPFISDQVNFTLSSSSPKKCAKKRFKLTCIPRLAAIKSLQKKLSVKKNPNNKSLVHIRYAHRDRDLATAVVNALMGAYQEYLKEEAKSKITQQLDYLEGKQNAALASLETLMSARKEHFNDHLKSGAILSSEKEAEFLIKEQAKKQTLLNELEIEMESLTKNLPSFPCQTEHENLSSVELKAAIQLHQAELEKIQIQQKQLVYCLEQLQNPTCDFSSIGPILKDPTLANRFSHVQSLSLQLLDVDNWSAKEKEQLLHALQLETLFLIQHITQVKESVETQITILQTRICELKQQLLDALAQNHHAIEENLHAFGDKAADFPERWLYDEKIKLHAALHKEMILSLAKVIETKSLSYHLNYLNCKPVQAAEPPALPNNPFVVFGFLVGALAGLMVACFIILAREIREGPTASPENLRELGYDTCGVYGSTQKERDLKTLQKALFFAQQSSTLLVRASSGFIESLASSFYIQGEKVLVLDFTQDSEEGLLNFLMRTSDHLPIRSLDRYDFLSLGQPQEYKETLLGSRAFSKLIPLLKKSYTRILLFSQSPLESVEWTLLQQHAEGVLYEVSDERLTALAPLPEKSAFLVAAPQKGPTPLRSLHPLLTRLLHTFNPKMQKEFNTKYHKKL